MKQVWDRTEVFLESEQRIADQTRNICVNGWLKEIEIEEIRHRCKFINLQLIDADQFAFVEIELITHFQMIMK